MISMLSLSVRQPSHDLATANGEDVDPLRLCCQSRAREDNKKPATKAGFL
jgi:hypothetical protein